MDAIKSNATVVIDNGSGTCKAGSAGAQSPTMVFPTIIGRPQHTDNSIEKGCFVGEEAMLHRNVLNLEYPIKHGIITHWDDMETVWQHTLDELHADLEEQACLLTEPPLNSSDNRERMTQIMFERFDACALYIAVQAVLSLYASGRTTGVVVDSGHDITSTVPVYEGYVLPESINRLHIGGSHLTKYMMRLLADQNISDLTCQDRDIARAIKEELSYVALEFDEEMQSVAANEETWHESYQLPGGQVIRIGDERFRCPEALFQPSFLDLERPGVHELLYNSITNSEVDIRNDLYQNILLSGGSTMFPGMANRIELEIRTRAPRLRQVNIRAPLKRKYSAWVGGSIFASLDTFTSMCVSKEEYEEVGLSIVHRKCP